MKCICKPLSLKYKQAYENAKKMCEYDLFSEVTNQEIFLEKYPGVVMSLFVTCGCPHKVNNFNFCGCSMCDYQSLTLELEAKMLALKERNIDLYHQAIFKQISSNRGENAIPYLVESLSPLDAFNSFELDDDGFAELYRANKFFKFNPYIINLETRATSINERRLKILSETISKRQRISIEIGCEVSNEWIRNHWINKGVSNEQIINAVNLIHKYNFRATGNALLGIPGFTEHQSIQQVIKTVLWLDEIEFDEIIILPLNRKEITLQGYIYKEFSKDPELERIGLVNGEHTTIPWFFSLIEALRIINKLRPNIWKKIILAQMRSDLNPVINEAIYNSKKDCSCNSEYIRILEKLNNKKSGVTIQQVLDEVDNILCNKCMDKYRELISKQNAIFDEKETMLLLSRKINEKMFSNNNEYYNQIFEKELLGYEY